jgi:hypothetical protein
MARDTDKAGDQIREAALDKELQRFHRHVFGQQAGHSHIVLSGSGKGQGRRVPVVGRGNAGIGGRR